MTDNPWYSFYVGDYSTKTAHLSLLEHGAYRLLLDHYYSTRSPLPNDATKLCRICRARSPSERKAVLSVVAEFFTEDGTLLRNERCDSEILKLLNYSNRQSAAAKQRHSQRKPTAKPRAHVSQSQPEDSVAKATSSTPTPLPAWMPIPEWEAYKRMRRKKRKTLDGDSELLAINLLDSWRSKGHDAAKVLNYSILGGYPNLYEPKENRNENNGRNPGHTANGIQQGASRPGAEQLPSKWQVAGQRVIDKIERGEI